MNRRASAASTSHSVWALSLVAALLGSGCGDASAPEAATESEAPQAISLSGEELYPPALEDDVRNERLVDLAEARARLADHHPDDPMAVVWAGRRLAYLGLYREAIATYTQGIERHPDHYKLYRHRGHRYISVRELDRAIADLTRAASLAAGKPDEVEPDGMPNEANVPRSTSQGNVWYHLALAHYLSGDFEQAARGWREGLKLSRNDDTLVATSHWLYMTLRRLGRHDEAAELLEPIREEMDILENRAYHELLLLYKGLRSEEELAARAFENGGPVDRATIGYGLANRRLYTGDRDGAIDLLRRVVAGSMWAAFGHIAAEADLARLGPG